MKKILLLFSLLCCLLAGGSVASEPSTAPVPAADFLRADGSLNLPALAGKNLSLELKGWNVSLDPLRGPVFAPSPAATLGYNALDKGLNSIVFAIAVSSTGDVYVGGVFTGVHSTGTSVAGLANIAKWNGSAWSALDKGLNRDVYAIAVSGSDVYVGGRFSGVGAGGTSVAGLNKIAKWNGSAWSALDKGLSSDVSAIAVSGTDVYVGGYFDGVGSGGTFVNGLDKIAKWNGSAWSALDGGLDNNVVAIAVSGTDVYVGGLFTAVGSNGTAVAGLNRVAKWNGSAWSALDKGLNNSVLAIAVSSTGDVYVGGGFTAVGSTGTVVAGLNNIAKWNGSAWSALDKGLNSEVRAIAVSSTADVYVGGQFTGVHSTGTSVAGLFTIAKWNGSAWSALDKGLDSDVYAIAVSGTDTYVGGVFSAVHSTGTSVAGLNYIARWGERPTSLTLGTAVSPTTCGGTNGSIAFTSTGIAAGSQMLSYKKDAAATATTVSVTVAADGSFTLSSLGKGIYSDFAIGTTTATGSRTLEDPASCGAFITRWDLSKTGSSATSINFGVGTTGTVSYTWTAVAPSTGSGSGTFTGITANITGLPSGGIIDLSISPTNFNRIYTNSGSDRARLMEIKQWGTTAWASMQNAFYGCSNMTLTATDVPNTAAVTDMSLMFKNCTTFNQALPATFNTAAVTDMNEMFNGCTSYNQPLPTNLNTAAVTKMSFMFFGCSAYNQPLPTNLNTAAVTNMSGMFSYCTAYNQPLPTNLNTAALIDMGGMFSNCTAYNQPLPTNLNTAAVTVMYAMFAKCTAYNQALPTNLNTAAVRNMNYMFYDCTAYNQPLPTNLNTAAVTDMSFMFSGATAFNQSLAGLQLNANVNLGNFLNNTALSVANYDATLTAFLSKNITGRNMGAAGLKYCAADADRANLVLATATGGKGWTITDGGKLCPTSLTLGTAVQPTACVPANGSIAFTSTGITAGSQTLSYKKDAAATATTVSVTVAADGSFTLTGLGAGIYSDFAIGTTTATGSRTLNAPSYSLAIDTPTNPTTCAGTNGKIAFSYVSGTIPDGTYSMSYSLGGSTLSKNVEFGFVVTQARVSAEASTRLTAFLTGLGAGSYSNFQITIRGCTVTPTGTTPVELSAPTTPIFTVGTPIKPTTCSATDGSLPLNGLANSTSYSVSYQKDGATAVVQSLISNDSGVLTIPSLGVGAYTNIKVTLNNCESAAATATVAAPTFNMTSFTNTQPTTCGGNGSIFFATNLPTGTYTLTYKKGGVSQTASVMVGSSTQLAPGNNAFTLSGITAGSYTDFKITHNGCDVTAAGPVTLTDPTGPTAFSVTGGSSFCTGGTGSELGLSSSQTGVNYQLKRGSDNVGSLVAGSGNAISFGNQATTGVYTVVATNTTTLCSTTMTGNATINNFPQPQASISGNATVCKDNTPALVSFTATVGTAPFIFSYKINNGATQTISSNTATATLLHPTNVSGVFEYSLVGLQDGNGCSQAQSGSITVNVLSKPSITLTVNGQTLPESGNQTVCDLDANPVNSLQFTVGTACLVGNPVWRVQIGGGAWSAWSSTAPNSQASDNQTYRYQAACDANCTNTYTELISVAINYRASTPQAVSLVADGTSVAAGEEKSICDQSGNALLFNATCASGEGLLYSVDGGSYVPTVPSQMVDGQFHNYRVRCQKSDGTPSCLETESGLLRLKISAIAAAPVASLNVTSGCGTPTSFSGTANCPAGFTTIWYNAATNATLPNLPALTPNETTSYYARCQNEEGCQSEKSNNVTFTLTPVNEAPVVSVSSDLVCTGQEVTVSTTCPAGASVLWNTGVTESSFKVAFSNITTQSYSAKCVFANGCQSAVSAAKSVRWKGFELTIINIGQSKSAIKTNDRAVWASQFVTPDGGPSLDNSTESNPTLYYSENANKTGPRYWTINADACALGTDGSMTFDMLATPETGLVRSFNTHENNAPYFMYANRSGWTELYAQNHPAYGFFLDNGSGGNVYDVGLPKGLYKLGVRYWDMKGWGSIYPSTRKPQGNVLAYQEFWFRIQSKDGIGTGAARVASDLDSSHRRTDGMTKGAFASVMPNPVSSVLRLKVTDAKNQKVNVSLLDASGRTLLQRGFIPETNQHQEEFNVSEMANGMYFLKVNAGDKQATLKVVKVQ